MEYKEDIAVVGDDDDDDDDHNNNDNAYNYNDHTPPSAVPFTSYMATFARDAYLVALEKAAEEEDLQKAKIEGFNQRFKRPEKSDLARPRKIPAQHVGKVNNYNQSLSVN
jgi:hypothetical protein